MHDTLAEHTNPRGERISVERVTDGDHVGDVLLVMWDDPPPHGSGKPAPMWLDDGTADWLREYLDETREETR